MTNQRMLAAAAARADITPVMGVQIAGDIGRYRPVEEIRDRLYAKVLILNDGVHTVCIVATDLTAVQRDRTDQLRARIAEYLQTSRGSVLIHATQTHSAPALGNEILSRDYLRKFPPSLAWIGGGDARYEAFLTDRVISAVQAARAALAPVRLRAARGYDSRVATNRRYISRDDTGIYQARPDNPNILCWEGPIDPEVGAAVLEDYQGRVRCAILHHTCHPCHGYPKRWISADWPGYWARKVEEHFGGGCVALVLNGACGNILHGNPFDPDHKGPLEIRGGHLVETTEKILPRLEELPGAPLRCGSKVLSIPLRLAPAEALAAARKLVAAHPDPIWLDPGQTRIDWQWIHAHRLLDQDARKKLHPNYDYEVQAVRIGGLAIIGWPGEPFVEAQLEVKKLAPARYVFVAHMCNDSPGYQPTRKAFKYGGYEVEWSDFYENTLDTVTAATRRLMQDVYDDAGAGTTET